MKSYRSRSSHWYNFKSKEMDWELRNEEKMIAKAKAIAKANREKNLNKEEKSS